MLVRCWRWRLPCASKYIATKFQSRSIASSRILRNIVPQHQIAKDASFSSPPPTTTKPDQTDRVLQLKRICSLSLDNLMQKISEKSIAPPFSSLNKLDPDECSRIITKFQTHLFDELEKSSLEADREKPIKLVDYMNPKLCNITAIIYSIQTGNYPVNFPQFYNLNTTQEFLTFILTKLFYTEFLETKLVQTTPENSTIDLSNPAEWFPEARKMKRKIIMHVGPTNSGKTHNSLLKLASSKSGYYAGPLRLLAREIYERFNSENIRCNLITGEEVIPSINEFGKISEISSGTIEMIPLTKKMDICVIDEIQMISDIYRGAAWTNALLGVLAKEVHLCGEESAVKLVKSICEMTGDEVEVKHYKRLGKLTVQKEHLKDLKRLQKGDCVIAFSKRKILEIKCKIEQSTDLKVAVIYGALPPEIRSKEATSFNKGEYDVLVASDAVGMGLNLKIRRIIFHTVKKFDGNKVKLLNASSTKQIGGRAGRFSKTEGESEGFVTAMTKSDLNHVKKMMKAPIVDLEKACIWPTNLVWKHYMIKFPKDTSFYDILCEFDHDTQKLKLKNYFISELQARSDILQLFLADDLYKTTTIEDQLTLSLAPINTISSPIVLKTAIKFLKNINDCTSKSIFDFEFLQPDVISRIPKINATTSSTVDTLQVLEDMHKIVLLFLWLSQRWPTLFVDKESATDMKSLIEKRISQELVNLRRLNKTK